MLLNVRSAYSDCKRAELSAQLELHSPDILGLNETWLDPSVVHLHIPSYSLVSRRDRPNSSVGMLNHGGIALYRRNNGIMITHLEDSVVAERSWHVIHTDVGSILLGLWYRPPGSPACHIDSFGTELIKLREGFAGTLVIGDLNIWHKKWLKHSPADTLDGERLHAICKEHSLKQLVTESTRGPNLLALVLASISGLISVSVHPGIADHKCVMTSIDLPVPHGEVAERFVWDFKHADWIGLRKCMSGMDLVGLVNCSSSQDYVKALTDSILEPAKKFIPTRWISDQKGSHPWLDDNCRTALRFKHEREGHSDYEQACHACTTALHQASRMYTERLKGELQSLRKGSKKWWGLANALMDNKPACCGIPSLRDPSGAWIHDGRGKAQLFADRFCSKYKLPEDLVPDPELCKEPQHQMSSFVLVRERWVRRELVKLREDQATGPDDLPARILKNCAGEICHAVTVLIRRILCKRCWPYVWKFHRICPLFKKGAVHKSGNYRGLHLTPVLSKAAERVIRIPFGKYLDAVDAYGSSQWAFRRKRGCTDLVLLLISRWLLDFQRKRKVGVFLSDISGAFDRVDANKLLMKLKRLGVCEVLLHFFADFLSPRGASVVVDGESSVEFVLRDMVFQGTVLGPGLWNIFFADVHTIAESTGCTEQRFADDLSTSKAFSRVVDNDTIKTDLRKCQSATHYWGTLNRVNFDPAKEEFVILGTRDGEGGPVRLLGPLIQICAHYSRGHLLGSILMARDLKLGS